MLYAYPLYIKSQSYNSLIEFFKASQVESGYATLVYFTSHVFESFQWLLFFTALIQIIPIYKCCAILKKELSIAYPMLVYMCLFYVSGFNVMRQSISCAWLLLAYVYLYKKRYAGMALSIIIAATFHSTFVVGIAFIVLSIFFDHVRNLKTQVVVSFVSFLLFVCLMKYWNDILFLLGRYGFLSNDKIIGYSNLFGGNMKNSSLFTIEIPQILECLFKIVFVMLVIAFRNKQSQIYKSWLAPLCLGIMVYLYFFFVYHMPYGYRISMYVEYYLILVLPTIIKGKDESCKLNGTKTLQLRRVSIRKLLILSNVVLYWLILYVVLGSHGTYPFKFFM